MNKQIPIRKMYRAEATERMYGCALGWVVQVGGKVIGQVARVVGQSGAVSWQWRAGEFWNERTGRAVSRIAAAEALEDFVVNGIDRRSGDTFPRP